MRNQQSFLSTLAISVSLSTAFFVACSGDDEEVTRTFRDAGPPKADTGVDAPVDPGIPPDDAGVPPAMLLSCNQILACSKACGQDKTCSQSCLNRGTENGKELANATNTCLAAAPTGACKNECSTDGGVDGGDAGPVDSGPVDSGPVDSGGDADPDASVEAGGGDGGGDGGGVDGGDGGGKKDAGGVDGGSPCANCILSTCAPQIAACIADK